MNNIIKTNILIVDDNVDLLDFITDDLEDDYKVFKALNGSEAIKIIKSERVELIVSDIMMSQMDGYELCNFIKNDPHYAHIPLIFLTAKLTIESKIKGLQIGADAYIEKPFSIAFIRAQIFSLLKNRIKHKEYIENPPRSKLSDLTKNPIDKDFLNQIESIILQNLDNSNFSVDILADMLFMSRPTLYRKVNSIVNMSPNDIINRIKLEIAVSLLKNEHLKLYEISNQLGYSSTAHFNRNFTKHYGIHPKDYITIKQVNT